MRTGIRRTQIFLTAPVKKVVWMKIMVSLCEKFLVLVMSRMLDKISDVFQKLLSRSKADVTCI